jgi:quercetin dioxygenase-like cupin family protein
MWDAMLPVVHGDDDSVEAADSRHAANLERLDARMARKMCRFTNGILADMSHRLLRAADAFWRQSNQMKTWNTDLSKQLEASALGARMWRLEPGKASTKHRHFSQEELYVLLEGTGRVRIDEEVLTLEPLDMLLVEPDSVRQLFNDTEAGQLWLVVGAPQEGIASTLEMSEEELRHMYPNGPKALPPELGGGQAD